MVTVTLFNMHTTTSTYQADKTMEQFLDKPMQVLEVKPMEIGKISCYF